MKSSRQKPDIKAALAPLKVFQRKTVDYVFDRLERDGVRRFLIADEVGLGKTLVARGIVARIVDSLWPKLAKLKRIDVIYICSNTDIARQNVNRLNVFDTSKDEQGLATRLTLLPLHLRDLDKQSINFVSFTPGTSFNLRSSGGIAHERALLYHLLRKAWRFGNIAAPKNLFQYGVTNRTAWHNRLDRMGRELRSGKKIIDKQLQNAFLQELKKDPSVRVEYRRLAKRFRHYRKGKNIRQEDRDGQREFIGNLRRVLAKACVNRLEPDIIILDEFQRFKDLLFGTDQAAELAQTLFEYEDEHTKPRLLLLSATPYKAYTLYQEHDVDDHYKDFLATVGFLFDSKRETAAFKEDLRLYREALFRLGDGDLEDLVEAKTRIEKALRKVMVRTERLSVGAERDGMLVEATRICADVRVGDLHGFGAIDGVAQALGVGDTVDYWKSAPYLLNLMDQRGYKIKREFMDVLKETGGHAPDLAKACSGHNGGFLSWPTFEAYQALDPGNARIRALLEETVARGAWQLLWIPPSAEYYRAEVGPYANPRLKEFSKSLLFSCWQIVPKAVATLCSYEAERLMMAQAIGETGPDSKTYSEDYSRRPTLLDFAVREGKPERMNSLTLFYPCMTLAAELDPVSTCIALSREGLPPTLEHVHKEFASKIESMLAPIVSKQASPGRIDENWYWASLALLDHKHHRKGIKAWRDAPRDWLWQQMMPARRGQETRFGAHVDEFWGVLDSDRGLGPPPDDLYDVLASVSLASPAVTALRSLLRIVPTGKIGELSVDLLANAAFAASGFRSLFNVPAVSAMLRSQSDTDESRYWEVAMRYCEQGNLQSVLDEYIHVLREALGLLDKPLADQIEALAIEIEQAVSIRTVNLDLDEITVVAPDGRVRRDSHSVRCRFALRFGDGRADGAEVADDEMKETRKEQVRDAFNSPFWPFVLASTSIGQEGLDFHQYCHNIFHWNLPSNPVDLEQREGRIHRYKGHAIRKNVSSEFWLRDGWKESGKPVDPWSVLFDAASESARQAGYTDELVPFWISLNAKHKIKRHVLIYPFSNENAHFDNLKRGLVAYRLVFGQARQEDLLAFIQSQTSETTLKEMLSRCLVDLSPRED